MSNNTTHSHLKRWLVAGTLALGLAACGGDDAVDSVAQEDGTPVVFEASTSTQTGATASEAEAPTQIDATQIDATQIDTVQSDANQGDDVSTEVDSIELVGSVAPIPTPTTTTAPVIAAAPATTTTLPDAPAPVEPVIEIECATNPPHASVTFGDPQVELDWLITASQHPGGTGLPSVNTEWGGGTSTPVEPQTIELNPNTISLTATTTNTLGEVAETRVSVERFTGCPVPNSFASSVYEPIDCVTGSFFFTGRGTEILVNGEPFDTSLVVDSVVVERWNGPSESLPVNEAGVYWVPGWDGTEEVKAVVTFTAADGTHEKHITHYCHEGPIGLSADYQVCADERLYVAYPQSLVSNIDIDGPEGNSCSVFQGEATGSIDNTSDYVTITSLGNMTLDEAAATLNNGPADQIEFVDEIDAGAFFNPSSGLRKDFERHGYELSLYGDTELFVYSKVWLIDVDGEILKVESDFLGLDVIDSMVASMQFVAQ